MTTALARLLHARAGGLAQRGDGVDRGGAASRHMQDVWRQWQRGRACCTSAPVASQSAEMVLTEEMRCASIALAVSLDSSALHRLVHRMRSSGTQCWYTLFSTASARCPLSVSFPPISTCCRARALAVQHKPANLLRCTQRSGSPNESARAASFHLSLLLVRCAHAGAGATLGGRNLCPMRMQRVHSNINGCAAVLSSTFSCCSLTTSK